MAIDRDVLSRLIASKAKVEGHNAWEGGYYHLANSNEIADAIIQHLLKIQEICADCKNCSCKGGTR